PLFTFRNAREDDQWRGPPRALMSASRAPFNTTRAPWLASSPTISNEGEASQSDELVSLLRTVRIATIHFSMRKWGDVPRLISRKTLPRYVSSRLSNFDKIIREYYLAS